MTENEEIISMLLPLMRDRLMSALTGTPDVLEQFLDFLDGTDERWDRRPEPERFTLREIVAHLADYEMIWQERINLTRDGKVPVFQPVDPAALAVKSRYGDSDPVAGMTRFRERRGILVDCLRGMTAEEAWRQTGWIGESGPLTLEEQAAFVAIHDGYHTGQVAQWLAQFRR